MKGWMRMMLAAVLVLFLAVPAGAASAISYLLS